MKNSKKLYYNKSTNGEILFYIGMLVFLLIECGSEWIMGLFFIGWIPIFLIMICLFRRQRYYIKREDNYIVFTQMKDKQIESITLHVNQVTKYNVEESKLIISTSDNEYVLDNFHIKKIKIDELFEDN